MESPQSASFVVYYKGVSLTVTQRDLTVDMKPLMKQQFDNIDFALSCGALPSWNKDTNEQIAKQTSIPVEPKAPAVISGAKRLDTPCVVCSKPAEIRHGLKKDGSEWSGIFCSTGDRTHTKWM